MDLVSMQMFGVLPIAVMPTIMLGGPLALLALLFPALCGGLTILLRRWQVALSVLSISSTVYLLHSWFYFCFCDSWWESQLVLWCWITFVVLIGIVRRRQNFKTENCVESPSRVTNDLALLGFTAALCVSGIVYGTYYPLTLIANYMRPLLAVGAGAIAGLSHELWLRRLRRNSRHESGWDTEMIVLFALGIVSACNVASFGVQALQAEPIHERWKFVPDGEGWIHSSPVIVGDRVFAATAFQKNSANFGALFCLDRNTGERIWTFTDDNQMKQVVSSPCYSDNRIYIGEGIHTDSSCKLFCVEADTGRKQWSFVTQSHTESTPCVVDGRVYFGAGADGLYCLNSSTGELIWHFTGPHVDGSPAVVNGHVYAGSFYGKGEVFCLDSISGDPVWRVPIEVSSFGSALVVGTDVFFGIGNGDLVRSDEMPSGALLCLECGTGRIKWRFNVADAVHARPVSIGGDIICVSRDHHCYCLDRKNGKLRWKRDLGSPIVSTPVAPVLTANRPSPGVYVLTSDGLLSCLDPHSGLQFSTVHLGSFDKVTRQFISSPAAVLEPSAPGGHCQLFIGGSLSQFVTKPVLFCFE